MKDNLFFAIILSVFACIVLAALGASGFLTDARRANLLSYGSHFRITVYSGGVVVKSYESTGKVFSENNSGGWYFEDKLTKKLVHVTGTTTVEQLN